MEDDSEPRLEEEKGQDHPETRHLSVVEKLAAESSHITEQIQQHYQQLQSSLLLASSPRISSLAGNARLPAQDAPEAQQNEKSKQTSQFELQALQLKMYKEQLESSKKEKQLSASSQRPSHPAGSSSVMDANASTSSLPPKLLSPIHTAVQQSPQDQAHSAFQLPQLIQSQQAQEQ